MFRDCLWSYSLLDSGGELYRRHPNQTRYHRMSDAVAEVCWDASSVKPSAYKWGNFDDSL